MSQSTEPDLIKVTEIFLVPSSFLVAALGTADTNPHRAGVSLLGLIVSALWWACCREALTEHGVEPARKRRRRLLVSLSHVFVVGWLLSLIVHLALWSRPLGS
jgi:hypothetical protein